MKDRDAVDPLSIDNREGLAQFLEGMSDGDIASMADSVDVNQVLERVFSAMVRDANPASAPDHAVVEWMIPLPRGAAATWTMTFANRACVAVLGPSPTADLRLRVALAPFLRLIAGQHTGMSLLSSGKLKVKGSLVLAASMESWFV